jgi:serine/threonine protein kinase
MPGPVTCHRCGTVVATAALTGLCPKCLLAAALSTASDLEHGTRPPVPEELGDWIHQLPGLELLELIGAGGMGWVYKAWHSELDQLVAVKILPSLAQQDPSLRERFSREARALAALNHPHVVEFIDSGVVAEHLYIVMEYVEGQSLRDAIKSGGMSPDEAISITRQVCDGLLCAHDRGVTHRDVKPGNILLDGTGMAKITDFGLARFHDPDADLYTLTLSTEFMGTPVYMSPEQRTCSHKVDHRADVYSLGVVLYELLTGKPPAGRFPPPSELAGTDPRLDKIVLQAVAAKPERRYQDIGAMKSALDEIIRNPDAKPAQSRSTAVRYGLPAALVLLLAAVTHFNCQRKRDAAEVPRAESVSPKQQVQPPPIAQAPFFAEEAQAHQEAWARHLGVPVEHTNSIGMVFRLIPPGEFTMGTPDEQIQQLLEKTNTVWILPHQVDWVRNEGAPRRVRLTKPFYLGVHEVTVGQFRRFVRDTGYATDVERSGVGGGAFRDGKWVLRPEHVWSTPGAWSVSEEQPVVHMKVDDAEAFCKWLRAEEDVEYALPTDVQWEYAARSGTQKLYYSGDDPTALRSIAWTQETCPPGQKHPQPVGGKACNAFGLHDTLGNVWEFCADGYAPGPSSAELQTYPRRPVKGKGRVNRSGSCIHPALFFARCGMRSKNGGYTGMGQGFRVAIVGDLRAAVKVTRGRDISK